MSIFTAISSLVNSLIDTRSRLKIVETKTNDPQIRDSSTGDYYRIKVDDGKIKLERVSESDS